MWMCATAIKLFINSANRAFRHCTSRNGNGGFSNMLWHFILSYMHALIFTNYLLWHYGEAFLDILNIWKSFFIFFYNFFSVRILLQTLFDPLQRMKEEYGDYELLDIGNRTSVFLINTLMRIVGFTVRVFILFLGGCAIAANALLGAAFFVIWSIMPLVAVLSFFGGLKLLFL